VLPIRATTPPSSSGSTLTGYFNLLARDRREALFESLGFFRRQRRRAGYVRAHHVLVRQQALAEGGGKFRNEIQLAAAGEQHEHLGHRRREQHRF
jgi:hypothetical protein